MVGTEEAAGMLHVSRSTVQRWIDADLLPSCKTAGRHRRVRERNLIAFAEKLGIFSDSEKDNAQPMALIVDDDETVLHFVKQFLRKAYPGFNVLTAQSGFEAGIILTRQTPQLVLLDIRMPGINGIQVCRTIKHKLKMKDTIVAGITVSRNKKELKELRKAGAEEILFKPLDKHTLTSFFERIAPSLRGHLKA